MDSTSSMIGKDRVRIQAKNAEEKKKKKLLIKEGPALADIDFPISDTVPPCVSR